jgi:hypothetical protein
MDRGGSIPAQSRVVRLGVVLFLLGVAASVVGDVAGYDASFPLATVILSYPALIVIFLSMICEDIYILYLVWTGVLKSSFVVYAIAIGRSLAIAPFLFQISRWELRHLEGYWYGSGVGG